MKQILITIAAILLIGCDSSPDHSGTYILSNTDKDTLTLDLKPDGSFTGMPKGKEADKAIGSWKVEGELLVCEGTTEKSSIKVGIKFSKTTGKLISISADGKEMPIEEDIPEGEDGIYIKKLSRDIAKELKDKSAQKRLKELDKGKKNSAILLVRSIKSALDMYRSDVGIYPAIEDGGLMALIKKPKFKNKNLVAKWSGPYVKPSTDFNDPWGNQLVYEPISEKLKENEDADYSLFSLGPNGTKGDEDDIGNILLKK